MPRSTVAKHAAAKEVSQLAAQGLAELDTAITTLQSAMQKAFDGNLGSGPRLEDAVGQLRRLRSEIQQKFPESR